VEIQIMGAKCSKIPDSQDNDRYRGSSRFGKTSRGPSPEPSPARHAKRMGFAEVSSLGATPPRPVEGGWGLKFADMRSQELSPTGGPEYRSKDEKRKLARALSTKATSVKSITSIVARKGALKVISVPKSLLISFHCCNEGCIDGMSSSLILSWDLEGHLRLVFGTMLARVLGMNLGVSLDSIHFSNITPNTKFERTIRLLLVLSDP